MISRTNHPNSLSSRGPNSTGGETQMMTTTGELIDSRDLIERQKEIEQELKDFEVKNDGDLGYVNDLEAEAHAIQALADEGIEDWRYGATLIREDYFTEYAQQLAEDVGAISDDAQWPLNRINWEAAADDLKMDYMTVEWDGHTYYVRS